MLSLPARLAYNCEHKAISIQFLFLISGSLALIPLLMLQPILNTYLLCACYVRKLAQNKDTHNGKFQ